ncbi:hypothetical protein H671_1g0126 [Cricetulus griseus]|nr:hypothetical protein H671_1g0126 [Cricetulus griseus]
MDIVLRLDIQLQGPSGPVFSPQALWVVLDNPRQDNSTNLTVGDPLDKDPQQLKTFHFLAGDFLFLIMTVAITAKAAISPVVIL